MSESNSFITNNIFVFSARIIAKLVTFFLMLFLARSLDPQNFGTLTLVITLANVFSIIQDFGTSFVVVREISSKNINSSKVLTSVIFIKTILGAFTFIGFIFSLNIMGYSANLNSAIILFAFGSLSESFIQTLMKYFEGREEMIYSSIIVLLERILIIFSIIFFYNRYDLIYAYGISYLVSNATIFIIVFSFITRKESLTKFFETKTIGYLLRLSIPFVVFNLFSIVYYKIDLFLISFYQSDFSVGIYRASYQLIESIYFISLSLSISLLPFFSRYFTTNFEKLKINYSVILKELVLVGLLIVSIILPNAELILGLLYPSAYLNGVVVLQIMTVTIPTYFTNNIFGNLLIAINKEKIQVTAMVFSTIFKILVLVILINSYGIVGAAIGCILSDLIMLSIQFFAIKKAGFKIDFRTKDYIKFGLIGLYFLISVYFGNNWILFFAIPLTLYILVDSLNLIKSKMK